MGSDLEEAIVAIAGEGVEGLADLEGRVQAAVSALKADATSLKAEVQGEVRGRSASLNKPTSQPPQPLKMRCELGAGRAGGGRRAAGRGVGGGRRGAHRGAGGGHAGGARRKRRPRHSCSPY